MTESEIFTDESEALYYRLRAIRDELERSEDEENDEVLNQMLKSTFESIEESASAEYKEKARSIVVKKNDPNVSSILFQEKMLKVESIAGIVLLLGGIAGAAFSMFGTGSFTFGLKAVIFLFVGIAAFVSSKFLTKFSMARMQESYKALEGKTIIGMRLKKRDFGDGDNNGSARMKAIAEEGKKKSIKFAVIALVILAILLVGGYLVFTKVIQPSGKYEEAEQAFKAMKYSEAISLYNELDPSYKDVEKKKEALKYITSSENEFENAINAVNNFGTDYRPVMDELTEKKNSYYYEKGGECLTAKNYEKAAEFFSKTLGYKDADAKKEQATQYAAYYDAEKKSETSLLDALTVLNGNHVSVLDGQNLITEYQKYVPLTGKYSLEDDTFDITGYCRKKTQYYVKEKTRGDLPIYISDDSEYVYMVVIADGDNEEKWYVNKDQVVHKFVETYEERGREKTRDAVHTLKK